ncbi:YlbF family regulator [Streptococcus didelphis]|uniref:YlbF family regulator n=2 Tax=Streptococcus didelphis TaxID=102886 RepID=A0ABY9LFF9_9STRE|nr:YlbF family regulator [Streptococcus didelphis]WMB27664.1 YlbF family regulator [Streptococcus didelphis]
MTVYNDSLKRLTRLIKSHESVISYKKIEKEINHIKTFKKEVYVMKKNQQNAVLFQQISKPEAAKQSRNLAIETEEGLNKEPIINDFRSKMQDASDLIQYITKTIEYKMNEELRNDKS